MTQNDFRMLKVISMGVALESTGLVMIESVVTRPDDPSSDKFTTIDMFPVFTYSHAKYQTTYSSSGNRPCLFRRCEPRLLSKSPTGSRYCLC